MLVADDVRVSEFFHDFDFLVDVLLEKGLLLDLEPVDDLDGKELLSLIYAYGRVTIFDQNDLAKSALPDGFNRLVTHLLQGLPDVLELFLLNLHPISKE